MSDLILNLDYGSFYTKAIWKFYEPGRRLLNSPAFGLSGSWKSNSMQANQSIQVGDEDSLKESFLLGRMTIGQLRRHRSKVQGDLSRILFPQVQERIDACGLTDIEILLNVHTPLQFQDSMRIAGSGVFRLTDVEQQLMQPGYRDLRELLIELENQVGDRALVWAAFLVDCIKDDLLRLHPCSLRVAVIPESLTVVNRMVDCFDAGEERQFLMLDIGHFTTDFALVAFVGSKSRRFVVRCANSIFQAGSRFIETAGAIPWIEKIEADLNQNVLEGRRPLRYMDLAVVLAGGGAAALGQENRSALVNAVRKWAALDPIMDISLRSGDRGIYYQPPVLTLDGLSPLRSSSQLPVHFSITDVPLHVPCIAACMHADDFREIRFSDAYYTKILPNDFGSISPTYNVRVENWVPEPAGKRCKSCQRYFKTERDLLMHVAKDHPIIGPYILFNGRAVSDGETIDIQQGHDLKLIEIFNWEGCSLQSGKFDRVYRKTNGTNPLNDLADMPPYGLAHLSLEGADIQSKISISLKITIPREADLLIIEKLFLQWISKVNRSELRGSLGDLVQSYRGQPEEDFVDSLHGFILAMTLRDRSIDPIEEDRLAESKLWKVVHVLGNRNSHIARLLTGISSFILPIPSRNEATGDLILDSQLLRLKQIITNQNFNYAWESPEQGESRHYLDLLQHIDRYTHHLLDVYKLPARSVLDVAPTYQQSPFLRDQLKWDLLLASAMRHEHVFEGAKQLMAQFNTEQTN